MRVVLREIDFKLRIYQQKSMTQKKRWLQLQLMAESDYERAMAERKEVERMEQIQREMKEKQADAKNKK
jgi:Fe2+ transport system protein B